MAYRFLSRISKARAVRSAWNHLIAADAANHSPHLANHGETDAIQEVELAEALDRLIALSHEDAEFLELIAVMLDTLSCSNPMASAFLCHVIDMAALPSKDTTRRITELILHKLKEPAWRLGSERALVLAYCTREVRVDRLVIFDFCVGCGSGLDGIVFCIRATIVIDLLVGLLDRGFNSHRVLHAGQNKQKIMSHPLNIRYIMANIIADLDSQQHRHRRRQQQIQQKPTLLPSSPTTLPPLHGLHQRRLSMRRFSLPKVRERSHETSDGGSGPTESDVIQENIVEEPTELRVHAEVETARKLADGHEEQTGDHHARASVYAGLVGSVKARDEQFRVRQLRFCTEWALKNSFGSYDETAASTTPASNTKDINVMMNTLDATPHWKMTEDGLEIRNDHSTFESIRATMSVMSGKWYYEVTLLTGGIMQIGWATRRCRFGPEDGTGVGDDDVSVEVGKVGWDR
ncbi:hypothetical protein BC938DRAFT_474462 [Jimgerdemannia flammicorona]|uniref:Uncharacterized protein n=1 Tax=Jimgerdemannia flammicorona TaxID=994334 RepID=A0A433QSJ0_9FUNG|nr:hypothetical protein BC938DRAFT_474462 [Jimgerdemannia flammicorona]